MRVLVCGAAGYIGSTFCYAAVEAGLDVFALDDLSTGSLKNLPPNVPFFHGDTSDKPFVANVLRETGAEAVVYFAGSVVVPESLRDPRKYYRNNTVAMFSFLESCIDAQSVKAFVFSSTAAVYGPSEKDGPLIEDSIVAPITPYGHSKLMSERILRDLGHAAGLSVAILRYFNVAGAEPLLRCGQRTPDATHLLKVACQTALGLREHLDVFGTDYKTPDGTGVRDFIHVSDLVEAHLAILGWLGKGREEPAVFNCGTGRGISVLDVIEAIERLTGKPLPVRFAPRREGDLPRVIADPAKLASATGWKARCIGVEQIVESALVWEKKLLGVG